MRSVDTRSSVATFALIYALLVICGCGFALHRPATWGSAFAAGFAFFWAGFFFQRTLNFIVGRRRDPR